MNNIVIFGCGGMLKEYADAFFNRYYNVLFLCDNNELLWGKQLMINDRVYEVKPPRALKEYKDIDVFILSTLYWEEISEQLYDIGCKKVHSPFADHPLMGEYPCFFDLKRYINRNPQKWYGSRKEFDFEQYRRKVYAGWNNHFRMHEMIRKPIDEGYLSNRANIRILDYGCGIGTLGLGALLRGYDFFGVDVDEEKHMFINSKIEEMGYPNDWGKRFLLYDGEKLPFPDDYFDAVFSFQVLEHVKSIETSIKEMLRVCKKDGIVYLHCPNYDRSYEEHYLLELGEPLRGNKDKFRQLVRDCGADESEIDNINFINKVDVALVIDELVEYEYIDMLADNPLGDIDYIIRRKK